MDAISRLRVGLDGRYSIGDAVGSGGMATVYRAHDLRHNRPVAIKVLHTQFTESIGSERFHREIETTANLRHPNILPLYDSGDVDGLLFYVMPLVEGESLRERLRRETRLPVVEGLRLAHEIANAIAYAHARGIVHRDIKPDNILLEGEHAIVADFGIARPVQPGGSALTATGMSVGTPAYMSPEQAAGEGAVDERTDQYALACVVFEMLSGTPPFTGPTAASVIRQHLVTDARALPRTVNVPAWVNDALLRALAKNPADRFARTEDFAAALAPGARAETSSTGHRRGVRPGRRVAIGAAALLVAAGALGWALSSPNAWTGQPDSVIPTSSIPDIASDPSIAVLPLANLSGGSEHEFLSDGISDQLTNLLGKVEGLRVIARTSAFSFKGKQVTIPEIARALNVAAILEGSVRAAGNRVRIDVRVIRTRDETPLWTETYDRTLDDILKVQDEIAAAVVKQLQPRLVGAMPKARATDPKAFAQDLQAQFLVRQGTRDSRERAVALFRQALSIDPQFVSAWNGLAGAYFSQAANSERPASEGRRLAREAVNSALEADANDPVALSLRGWIAMTYDDDFVSAARHFERAMANAPNPGVIGNAAMFLQNLGRSDEAIAATLYQLEQDPANPRIPYNLTSTYYYAGYWDEAVAMGRRTLAMSPARTGVRSVMALALLHKGDARGGLEQVRTEPSDQWRLPALAMVQHALGAKASSDSALAEMIARFGGEGALAVASVFAYRGEADSAFHWLDRAANQGGVSDITIDPAFRRLHRDARWLRLLHKLGKAPEQLSAIRFRLAIPK
jgi:serine/threonine protein kinase/tetratricopeptide (TPR) repeat protein